MQEYGRYFDMPTVCFRGGCLTGPEPRRRAAARLPLLPDALHGHRRAVHGASATTASRCATTSTRADLVRAFEAFHASPRAAAVYNIGGGRESNCSMLEAIALCERDRRATRSTGRSATAPRIGDHRWWISDLERVPARLPGAGSSRYDVEDDPARDPRRERRALDAWPREALGRHPGAQRGRVDRARRVGGSAGGARRARRSTTRSSSSTTRAATARGRSSRALGRARTRASAGIRSHYPRGFGFAVRAGLERFSGDAVAIVMADGSDAPDDLVALLPPARGRATTARSARASCRGARVHDYPRFKLVLNRIVNLGDPRALPARLQRHDERVQGLPARGDRERPAAALEPLQPDRRAAAEGVVRGHSYAIVPDLVDEPRRRARRS